MFSMDWSIFGLGAFGAFAPEVVRLWQLRTTPEKFEWSGLYVVGSVLMCVLGGVVAVLLAPDTGWKVFYAGLTAPVVVSKAGEKLTTRKPPGKVKSPEATPAPAAPMRSIRSAGAFFRGL